MLSQNIVIIGHVVMATYLYFSVENTSCQTPPFKSVLCQINKNTMADSDAEDIFVDPIAPTVGTAKVSKLVKVWEKSKRSLKKTSTQSSSIEPSASEKVTDIPKNLPLKCTKSVVLDLGNWSIKAGFAGDPSPCCELPSLMDLETRFPAPRRGFVGCGIGEDSGKINPLYKGVVTDWNALESLLRHVFDKDLKVPFEEHAVLLSDPPLSPNTNREKYAEFMFETLGTPAMHIAKQSVLSVYSYGRTSGLVVDSSHGSSHIVPVHNGHQLPRETCRVGYGGQSLNIYLTNMLQNAGQTVPGGGILDDSVLHDIKKKCCYVPVDPNVETRRGHVEYSLSKGKAISLSKEQCLCPEALFRPDLLGSPEPGLPTLIMNSVNRCSVLLKSEMLENILVCGGSTMFTGVPERLQREMDHLVPMSSTRVVAAPERQNTVWVGGSILASLEAFQSLWVRKQEYEERGAFVIYRKCF